MIEIDREDTVAVIRMVHGKVNAMDLEFCEHLTRVLEELDQDDVALDRARLNRVRSAGRIVFSPSQTMRRRVYPVRLFPVLS